MTALISEPDMRAIIGDVGGVSIVSTAALQVIIDSSQSEIDHVCGGPNAIGAQFINQQVMVDTCWNDPRLDITHGNKGPINWIEYRGSVGDNIAVLTVNFDVSVLSGRLQTKNYSSYLVFGGNLFEFTYDNAQADGGEITYQHAADDSVGMKIQAGLTSMRTATKTTGRPASLVTYVAAYAGAYVPISAKNLDDLKKQALVELTKLKIEFDATQSLRDGTYSKTSADYSRERRRILRAIQDRVA